MGGPSAELSAELISALRSAEGRDNLNPAETGIAVLEAMRAPVRPLPSGAFAQTVGGEVQMATVNAEGVWMDVVHSWPDSVGKKIKP